MKRRILKGLILMLMIGMALATGWILHNRHGTPAPRGSVPTIQQIQGLSMLVSTRIELSDVVESQIRGYTGGVKAVLLVKGDVLMSVDLSQARFEQVDEKSKTAVLVLPKPKALSPRLDHRRTRLVSVQSQGLWLLVPSDKDKEAAIDRAYGEGQKRLERLAENPELIREAKGHAEGAIGSFVGALGWAVSVRWQG